MKMERSEAMKIFYELFPDFVPGPLEEITTGWAMSYNGSLSSYDDDTLTQLVLMAHARAVRVEVIAVNSKIVIVIEKRDPNGDRTYNRHPNTANGKGSAIIPIGALRRYISGMGLPNGEIQSPVMPLETLEVKREYWQMISAIALSLLSVCGVIMLVRSL